MTTARPDVAATTLEAYDQLPELYRDADAALGEAPATLATYGTGTYGTGVYGGTVGAYPLLRYLALLLDQLAPVATLVDRFVYTPADDPAAPVAQGLLTRSPAQPATDTADLVDPARAEAGWLPWLAQLLGNTLGDPATLRARLATPETAWAHGTPDALRAAVRGNLTGTRTVDVVAHYTGDPFTLGVVTDRAETPSADTWATLKAASPTWGDLVAAGSYASARVPALSAASRAERPAGYRITHVYTDEL